MIDVTALSHSCQASWHLSESRVSPSLAFRRSSRKGCFSKKTAYLMFKKAVSLPVNSQCSLNYTIFANIYELTYPDLLIIDVEPVNAWKTPTCKEKKMQHFTACLLRKYYWNYWQTVNTHTMGQMDNIAFSEILLSWCLQSLWMSSKSKRLADWWIYLRGQQCMTKQSPCFYKGLNTCMLCTMAL